MCKNFKKISYAVMSLTIVVATALFFANGVHGSEERPAFTLEKPADYITFNSITNNPNVYNSTGDERDFVMVSATNDISGMTNNLTVTNGQEVYVLSYVHNNAASNLNLVAKDVMSKFDISQKSQLVNGKYVLTTTGYVNSSNAKPTSVYDDATFTADKPFSISYVEGTAKYSNGTGVHEISNPTVGNGAKLGYNQMDGNVQGCMQFSGWVRFKVMVDYDEADTGTIDGLMRFWELFSTFFEM